ncbi:dihydrofolate reductase family protein [Microbacterium fluvii]|uniref:Dihydrofolate reductase family protein n=1 Tax=Microbacterium fluvii TaxID=415215 RepID=A0ABW2HAN6_9MICO|nr:dihydrofolate reductase family protein [Microbacterium fluvii]MCU4671982.1 dihydrofolate reductase family protein [Microbacterium fluvii]
MSQLVTEVIPSAGAVVDVATAAGRDWLAERYRRAEESYLRLNMITSLTGAAAGEDGTSDTLTSTLDRRILGLIRADADAVVVGAQSVRAEGYVVPRTARLAVVTSSGDLSGHRLDDDGSAERVLVVCPQERADDVSQRLPTGATVVPVASAGGHLRPEDIVDALARRGLRRLVCEGGPSLAAQFADAGLIDEYCVTVAPTIAPAARPFLPVSHRVGTTPAGLLVDAAGFSYLRLRAR